MELLDLNNPTTLVGSFVVGALTIAMWLKKWGTAWKAEGLEAAKIDSQAEIVAALRDQLKELTQETKDLRSERRQLQESVDAITAHWREDRRQLQETIDSITEQWKEERAQWAEEREKLADTVRNLTKEVEELKAQRCWDGINRRRENE